MAKEIQWSCGCYEIDDKLEVECTQTPLQGDLSAERHAVARPYSAKCFRLAAASDSEGLDNTAVNQAAPTVMPAAEPPLDAEKLAALHVEEANRPE